MILPLAFNVLDPLIETFAGLLTSITALTHNFGWSLVLLAVVVKGLLWPLNTFQYRSMANMQMLQPKLRALQEKFRGDPQKLNTEMMALYKESGVNPAAGCWPLMIQMPVLLSLYWAITRHSAQFKESHWLWIGSGLADRFPTVIAKDLASPDMILFGLYVISMYLSVRFGSAPSSDPQQAQTQRIMAIVSPLMLTYFGWKYKWPAALVIYWLMFNILQMVQQMVLMRKFAPAGARVPVGTPINVTPASGDSPDVKAISGNGSSTGRRSRRRSRR